MKSPALLLIVALGLLLAAWDRLRIVVAGSVLAGCAWVQPVPCEDVPVPTANGPRLYPELCPQEDAGRGP